MALLSAESGLVDPQPWPQPAPKRGREQQLHTPAKQTRPACGIRASAEAGTDPPRTLLPDTVAPQRLHDDRGGIPAPRMEPVRQPTGGMTTIQTQKSAHPDENPGALRQPSDLPAVHAVADHLQPTAGFACRLPTETAELRTKGFDRWGLWAAGAELFDREGQAVYNNHCFVLG